MSYGVDDFYNQFIKDFPSWFYERMSPIRRAGSTISYHADYDRQIKEFMESPWDEDKYSRYLMYRSNSITSPFIQAYEGKEENRQYMENYGLTWDGVKYAWRLPGTNKLTSAYGALNYVSKNVERLYR